MKRLLCIISQPPYRDSHSLEALEATMVAAAFDMEVSVLFTETGIWHLQQGQNAASIGVRTVGKVITALQTYEVDQIYVCQPSIAALSADPRQFVMDAHPLDYKAQADLIAGQNVVLRSA